MKDHRLFSVIIPTLWRSNRIHRLISDLINCPYVGEILLVDNSNSFNGYYSETHSKIKLIVPKENLFINPSWNLAVSLATYENIALCNDDINFSMHVFEHFSYDIRDLGLIGQSESNYNKDEVNQVRGNLKLERAYYLSYAFGCLMLLDKSNYVEIPKSLRICYGDNWLLDHNISYKLFNLNIEFDRISTTTSAPEFTSISYEDEEEYKRLTT